MARKVRCRGAGGLGQAPEQVGAAPLACVLVVHVLGCAVLGVSRHSRCPGKHPALVGGTACARC